MQRFYLVNYPAFSEVEVVAERQNTRFLIKRWWVQIPGHSGYFVSVSLYGVCSRWCLNRLLKMVHHNRYFHKSLIGVKLGANKFIFKLNLT